MSNYTKLVDFATKDSLPTGDPDKIIKGTEIETEYDNIAVAIATKSDSASPTFTGTVTIPTLSVTGVTTVGGDILSDTDSTDSLGSTGVRWLKVWTDTLTAGTLTIGAGSIVDASGAISFGDDNLVTTGTLGSGALTATSLSLTTNLAVSDGGTGASTLTNGGVLLGSGTGAITAMAVLADGEMIVGDGTTNPVAESGATLRSSIGVDAAGTDNSTDVTLAGTGTYLSLSGQTITVDPITLSDVSDSGTAAALNTGTTSGLVPLVGTKSASLTLAGLVEQSTSAENVAGTDDTVFPSVAGTKEMIDTHATDGVTSIEVSGGTTGLTTSGGPVTGSGTITLAGTLAVASGGTGGTTSTGTGAVVLASSPTLVTPALGTPSAIVLTNATGTAASLTAGVATLSNALKSATTTVSVSGATAPSTGQVLTATSGTEATWQTLPAVGDASTSNPLSQFAATTSAQLAGVMSDETGTGSVVFNTSPTLVTPVLGTPASGTLTNATGLPPAGVVGTAAILGANTFTGTQDFGDNTAKKLNLLDYGEVTNAIGSTGGGTQDIDLTLGNYVTATVDTSANTFTFSNPTASDEGCGFTLVLTNGGSQTVNWPASVDWPDATAPTLTAAGVDKLVFETSDGGTTWLGNLAGAAYA
jgi:hypothetical protein